ncbi:MAG TPA: serine/threonine protein kinase [Cyanophyceae cyanobacterium]
MESITDLHDIITQTLLPDLQIESVDPHNPIVVHACPNPWKVLGVGNYAAVLCHPDYPEQVVKIYAPGRPGWQEEVEVYRRLGNHPAFSCCYDAREPFLVLKRLHGVTLYDCMHLGLFIPKQVIQDIDRALADARQQGLYPHDVHGRNVMMLKGRGLVVDVSDFLHQEACSAWDDLKRAYYWLYLPLLSPLRLRLPYWVLDGVRAGYRLLRRLFPYRQRVRLKI